MKTFNFEDTYDFIEYLDDTYEKLFIYEKEKDYSKILVVAKYDAMIEILNSLLKNTNYKLVSCNDLNHPYWDGYNDAFVLTIDSDMSIWVQAAKFDDGKYIYVDDTDIVFVHGDVDSAFIKQNKDSSCIMNEFNIAELDDSEDVTDECDDYDEDESIEDTKVTYKINGKKVSKDEYDRAVKKFDEDWNEHFNDDNYWEYLFSFPDVVKPRFTYNTNRYLHPLLVDLWRY